MNKNVVIILALAASLAAGALCFASTAADVTTTAERAEVAEPAPAGPATATPFTAPRYFNPYTPPKDNPTNPPGTWEVYPSPTNKHLTAVDFIDVNNGWAVGAGVALRYSNGSWKLIPGHNADDFDDLDMVSLNDGWAVGWNGNKELPAIWRWNGSDWREFQNPTGTLYCIDMIDDSHGWIGGKNYFLRYNGSQWVSGGSAPGGMYGIHMNSETDGRASGYGYIMRRLGINWSIEANNSDWNLASILMVNASRGWVTGQTLRGEKGILLEYAGTWREYKIYEKARSIARLDIYQGDFGWAVGWRDVTPPYGAFLLFYDGLRWEEVNAPWEKATLGVKVIDRSNAWIVGYAGLILKYKPNVPITPSSLGTIKVIFR
jgi:hypothetical protein